MDDPWSALGVPQGASDEDVRAAYRRLAARHHPDLAGGSAERMAQINEAYTLLRDRQKRAVASDTAPIVEHAESDRPLGCVMAAAVTLVIAAATIAGAIALSRNGDSSPDDETLSSTPPTQAKATSEEAPWVSGRLPAATSRLAVSVWQRSSGADSCPLIVPIGADAGGTARVVDVAGGWGVAWGRANEPDLFGVTARPGPPRDRGDAEAALSWTDGSEAALRRDGNRLVADLVIEGVDCTYGVFSTQGFDNLTEVLGALRFVDIS